MYTEVYTIRGGKMVSAEPTANEIRRQKGMEIAQTCRIMKRERGGYVVPSQSGGGCYIVKYVNFNPVCECPDYELRKEKCKHCWAVEIIVNKQVNTDGSATITKTVRATYPQDWSAYNQAQTRQEEICRIILNCPDISQNNT